MPDSTPSFVERFASAVAALRRMMGRGGAAPEAAPAGAGPRRRNRRAPGATARQAPLPAATEPQSALQLLSLFQQNGRLLDFLQEDITGFSDREVGAAARLVHQGCRQTLEDYLAIRPIREEPEGTRITIAAGFDAAALRLTGNVLGEAPFTGTLIHRGWRATQVRLPQVAAGHDLKILTAAEVEL